METEILSSEKTCEYRFVWTIFCFFFRWLIQTFFLFENLLIKTLKNSPKILLYDLFRTKNYETTCQPRRIPSIPMQ